MTIFQKIHNHAVGVARKYKRSQGELVEAIQQVDAKRVFKRMGYNSLFQYCIKELLLSESDACAYIAVARKAVIVPEIKKAIVEGTLTVSIAKRITRVITPENKEKWLAKAQEMKQRELERELAQENPREAIPETVRPKAKNLSELRCGISWELEEKLRHAQDLLSQKEKRSVTLEETLEILTENFLERNDPVRKAERNQRHSSRNVKAKEDGKRNPIPAGIRHQVVLRDQGRCQHPNPDGSLCGQARWTELHHKVPVSLGGEHSVQNLLTLCATHHRYLHQGSPSFDVNRR